MSEILDFFRYIKAFEESAKQLESGTDREVMLAQAYGAHRVYVEYLKDKTWIVPNEDDENLSKQELYEKYCPNGRFTIAFNKQER